MKNWHPTERQIQRAIVQWCRLRGLFCFHIPNGGSRSPREGAELKKDGVMAGVPDLVIPLPKCKIIWMEVKSHNGTLSIAQKAVHALMGMLGHKVYIVRSLEEAQLIIMGAGG